MPDLTLKQVQPRCRKQTENFPPPQPEIELSVAMPKFFDTTSDRRQFPRTKLVEIAYIGMGPENGGLVLDVSDGGLSFHSVAPVQQAETIRFLLSLRGHSRIEGAGEVVWTNEMRTVCGLRFTSLSSGAREHLNNWTNQSRMPVAARGKSVSSSRPASPQIQEAPVAAASPSNTVAAPVFAIPPADVPYLAALEDRSFLQRPRFVWVMFGLLGAVLAVIAFFYGVHVGKSQITSVARSATASAAQTEPPDLAPDSVPEPPVTTEAPSSPAVAASAPAAATTAPAEAISVPRVATPVPAAATSAPTAAPSVPASVVVSASKNDETAASKLQRPAEKRSTAVPDPHAQQEAGKSELAAALAYLNGDNGQRDSAKAVHQLWAAVRDGNSEAEVILSDLYVTGDGVAKSCEQGRVLLKAATKSGNFKAKVKLDELDSNGCQ